MSITILYIHQSAELYGSDKTLLDLVKGVNSNPEFNVVVVLPEKGPLKDLLQKSNIKVLTLPVIKISREIFNIKKLTSWVLSINPTYKKLKEALGETKIDIVHSNTLAVFLGAVFAYRNKTKLLWHVHEIIRKPKIVKKAYPTIVNFFSDIVVFNSEASRSFLTSNHKKLKKKSIVNLNAISRDVEVANTETIKQIRKEQFNASEHDLVLGLVGRISKWKGQDLLLEVFNSIHSKYSNLKLVFVGSAPPNQDYLIDELVEKIQLYQLKDKCKIVPFQENIWPIWDSLDICIIPSKEPEPFGLVALEAMLAKKPVIAARHGGLIEIVDDGKTGYFFTPNDKESLQKAIEKLITNDNNISQFGINGYQRATEDFSKEKHICNFEKIYKDLVKK